jgi:hypothetical protein
VQEEEEVEEKGEMRAWFSVRRRGRT